MFFIQSINKFPAGSTPILTILLPAQDDITYVGLVGIYPLGIVAIYNVLLPLYVPDMTPFMNTWLLIFLILTPEYVIPPIEPFPIPLLSDRFCHPVSTPAVPLKFEYIVLLLICSAGSEVVGDTDCWLYV